MEGSQRPTERTSLRTVSSSIANYVHHPLHGTSRSFTNLNVLEDAIVGGGDSSSNSDDINGNAYELVAIKQGESYAESDSQQDRRNKRAIDVSISVNAVLAVAKLYAVLSSSSLAVLASLMDSALDLVSQAVVRYTERRAKAAFDVDFPAGQQRMEPVGVMCCAGLMCMASVEVIRQSTEVLLGTNSGGASDGEMGTGPGSEVEATALSVAVIIAVILSKVVLWRWCRLVVTAAGGPERCSSVAVLAQDHGNDVSQINFGRID